MRSFVGLLSVTLLLCGGWAYADPVDDLVRTEMGLQAATYLRALVPELRIRRPTAPAETPRLRILGHPGQTYAILASSNLVQWTTLQVLNTTTNRFEFTDPHPAGTQRYYRVQWLAQP